MDITKKLKVCQWIGALGLPVLVGLMVMRFMFKVSFPGFVPLFFCLLIIYLISVKLKNGYMQKL